MRLRGLFVFFVLGCGRLEPSYDHICEGYEKDLCVALSYVSERPILADTLLGEIVWGVHQQKETLAEFSLPEEGFPVTQPLVLREEMVGERISVTALAFLQNESVAEGEAQFRLARPDERLLVRVEMKATP